MAANSQMHNLTTLIKRLEAATSRLEDIASSTEPPTDATVLNQAIPSPPNPSLAAPPPPAVSDSDSKATTPAAAKPESVAEPLPESIEEFDAFLNTSVDKYVKLSHQLGGLVAEQAALVKSGFQEQRKFLLISTKAKKPNLSGPDLPVYESLIKPINEALMAVTELKDANRPSPMYTQLSTVSDGIMVLAWVTIDTRPYKHVDECLGSAQFFGNRVLKEQKDKDPKQIEWVQSFYQMFRDLADYVKQYFPTGIPWNSNGQPAQEVLKSLSAGSAPASVPTAAAPAAGGAPPPPPPP
ncbi:adenylate cyclase-associated, partial [Fusarium napiforme]